MTWQDPIVGAIDDVPPQGPEGCPVVPLGHRGGSYYFTSPSGELRSLRPRDMTFYGVRSLFDGDMDWLADHFPMLTSKGAAIPDAFELDAASLWLMRACVAEGHWDPTTPIRGPGVWRGDDGLPIAHCGNRLLMLGPGELGSGELVPMRAGIRRDGALYASGPSLPRPGAPARAVVGLQLMDDLRLWNFEGEIGPDAALGWLGQSYLGAAPSHRGHMLVLAQEGSGKTELCNLFGAALGGQGQPAASGYSEAGLRAALSEQARGIILDEAEYDGEDPQNSRILQVIQLLRLMTSGSGRVLRMGPDQKLHAFSVAGSAFMACIIAPPLKPQDRRRITELRLNRLREGQESAGAQARVHKAIEHAGKVSTGLRARALLGWPRFLETLKVYRTELMRRGTSPYDADQIGTLIAGRDLLTTDDVPESAAAADEVVRWMPLLMAAWINREEGQGQRCLTHLYSSPIDLWRSGARRTVGQEVRLALYREADEARRQIQTVGLKLVDWQTPEKARLLIANNHVGLARVFDRSAWAGGAWSQALRYLPTASAWPKVEKFAGAPSRATVLPASLLPGRDDEEVDGAGIAEGLDE